MHDEAEVYVSLLSACVDEEFQRQVDAQSCLSIISLPDDMADRYCACTRLRHRIRWPHGPQRLVSMHRPWYNLVAASSERNDSGAGSDGLDISRHASQV
jgi:hypothetical protein